MPAALPKPRLTPGTQIYKYELQRRIGAGSFGEVWLAVDRAVEHEFAVKILLPDIPLPARLREAQIGHTLLHDNLVRVHQADVANLGGHGLVIIAMDFMPNGPVTRRANSERYLILPDVTRFGCDILRGLEYLHAQGLFHNDIKPDNVLVGPHDQGMLTDYGIVGATVDGAPAPAAGFYKVHAAPELAARAGITAQTDIFQTGMALYRMLVGLDSLPAQFQAMGEAAYYAAIADGSLIGSNSFPDHVPNRLRRIILKAINPDPASRYATALEMRRDLERLRYPGYWTVWPDGRYVGVNNNKEYRFDVMPRGRGSFEVLAFRKNLTSGRETRFTKYCCIETTERKAMVRVRKFVKDVVEGL